MNTYKKLQLNGANSSNDRKSLDFYPTPPDVTRALRWNLFMQHPPAYVLPLTWRPDFLNGTKGGSPTMECLWTVWISGNTSAQYIPLLKPL